MIEPAVPDWQSRLVSCLLFLLPALALTTRSGIGAIELAVLLIAIRLARPLAQRRQALFAPAAPVIAAFALQALVAVGSLAWSGFHWKWLDSPLRQLLALLAIGIVGLARPAGARFWQGLFVGSLGALAFACYQRFAQQLPRAEGFSMAIVFGDMATAIGLMSLASIERLAGTRLAALPYLGFAAGIATSILSGTRGGWIALPMSFVPLYTYGDRATKRKILATLIAAAALFAVAYAIPQTEVRQRVADAFNEVSAYFQGRGSLDNSSVGLRLEMWKAVVRMFAAHPLLGVGRANFHAALNGLVAQGSVDPAVRDFYHAHNEMLNALATEGIFGALALVFVYAAPLAFFLRAVRQGNAAKPYALAGLMLVLSYIDFGLTQVMFAHHIAAAFYALVIGMLAGLCIMKSDESR